MRYQRASLLALLLSAIILAAGCHGFFTDENGTTPSGVATARFAYVANAKNTSVGSISAYTINASNGLPVAATGATAFGAPFSITIDSVGSAIYVADPNSSQLEGFLINRSTGALSQAAGSPFADLTMLVPAAVAITPNSKFLYVLNQVGTSADPAAVVVLSVGVDGVLAVLDNSQHLVASSDLVGMTVDPSGHFLYVANRGNLLAYAINTTTGLLTAASPIAVSAASSVVTDPNTKFAYVAVGSSGVNVYSIDSTTGALTQVGSSSTSTGGTAVRLAMDPKGKFLFAVNQGSGTGTVAGFTINSDGTLTRTSSTAQINNGTPTAAAVDFGGAVLYVTADPGSPSSGVLNVFSFTSSGALTFVGSAATDIAPTGIVLSK